MTNPTSDYLIERRRLSRRVSLWRIVAFVAVGIAILILGFRGVEQFAEWRPHIAKLRLTGILTGQERTLNRIRDLADSSAVAVLVDIDSPGGTTEGSEAIYEELRRLGAKKPVVAVVGGVGASGAYIAALACERIYARGNSLVGSIGVLAQYPNVSELLDKLGVKYESIKSSPLKAAPNGLEPTSEAARAAVAAVVADSYAWFKDLVRTRRALSDEDLAKVVDGRVFTGRQGLPLKLVDAIGGEREAIAWLESEKGIAKDLPVRESMERSFFDDFGPFSLASGALDAAGLPGLAGELRRIADRDSGSVDGLMSLWHF